MMRKRWIMLATVALACAFTACSGKPAQNAESGSAPQPKPEIKPADAETGMVVLQRLYTTSRGWAGDTLPVSLQSQNYKNAGGNPKAPLGHDGKSAVWRAVLASAMRRSMKTYMWSGLTGPDAPSMGITPGNEDAFSPGNISTQPFQMMYLKNDSDKVLETANKHGGAAQLKKNADLPVNFSLSWDPRRSMLAWHVLYGKSANEPDLDVVVDATSGQFVRVEK